METLSHKDFLALNNAIGELYAVREMESFIRAVFGCLTGLIPADFASFNEHNNTPSLTRVLHSSKEHEAPFRMDAFNEHIGEHFYASHFNDGNIIKTTDVTSVNRFKETTLYNEYYRYLDIEAQIIAPVPLSQGKGALYALSRKCPDFSERDRTMLALFRPHLITAFRNITEMESLRGELHLLQKGAEVDRQGVILLQSDGKVLGMTLMAKELVERYFKKAVCEGDSIPANLLNWFKGEISSTPKRVEREPLLIESDGCCLKIRGLIDFMTGDYMLVMNEIDPSECIKTLKGYGLSDREIDVMKWLCQGKSNVDISEILGINRRTVEKHVERIFIKLGVETRAAAAAVVMQK